MALTIQVLGPLVVSGAHLDTPRLSKAVRHFIALLAAAGPSGISRDQLAMDLWGEPLPESWKSALRNRTTAARRALGAEAIVTESSRFRFGSHVVVDSWQLVDIAPDPASYDGDPLRFLEGEPYEGKGPSPRIDRSIAKIRDLRAVLIQQLANSAAGCAPVSASTLTAFRNYQRRHPLDAAITESVVRAHLEAGDEARAHDMVRTVKLLVGHDLEPPAWVDALDSLFQQHEPGDLHDDQKTSTSPSALVSDRPSHASAMRADLFAAAVADEDWGLALDVATNGLPAAARMEGDPARLALLEAIPLDKLSEARRFDFASTLSKHLMYAKREHEARDWSTTARSLASTPNEHLLAYILGAVVGDSPDQRASIPLPPAFRDSTDEAVSLQSLQVAVMSHLERAPAVQAAPLCQRFNELVDASADPYRRWHMMLLESMIRFVDGDITSAKKTARRAHQYGELSNIADAEVAMIGQLANARWVHRGFEGAGDIAAEFPDSASSLLGRALQIAYSDEASQAGMLDEFMGSIDVSSRSFFTFPTLVIVAHHIRSPNLRHAVRERLRQRSSTSAIWGTGVLHLGPVDRSLARLCATRREQRDHLHTAVQVADQQQTRLWQVVCRLDLAKVTGDGSHRAQAAALATSVDLQELVDSYEGIAASN